MLDQGAPAELLLDAAFKLSRSHDLDVFDPQIGQVVTEADRERIAARIAETCSYRADTLGDVALGLPTAAPSPGGVSTSARIWLILAGVIVAVLLLSRACRCVF